MAPRTLGARKRSLPTSPLPPHVAWLERLTMEVSPVASRPRRVEYLLSVTWRSRASDEATTWQVLHSFDDYRAFRKRVLTVLRRGHFCQAECPWLYTFVKSYFPKPQLVGCTLSRIVARRRKTLTRSLATLRSFLLNRSNHVCPLVTQCVARELLAFVLGGSDDKTDQQVPSTLRHLLQSWQGDALELLDASFGSNEADSAVSDDPAVAESDVCALCQATLSQEPRYDEQEAPIEPEEDEAAAGDMLACFTTLRCGHHFHDECLIDKLNEALQCPTCGCQEAW